jgi:hypothetical protein
MPGIQDAHEASARRRVLPFIYLTLAVVLGFFLLTEHRAHLFGALPFLLILACPLMHMFMHKGHGSHSHGVGPDPHAKSDRDGRP